FATLIGATRETVRQKLKRREVLGLQGAKRGVRYPAWQVTRDGGLLPGLPALFELLGDSPWAVFRFLTQPVPGLGGEAPKDRLRAGKVAEVLDLAEGQARGDFG
ncbi:antitoxin Xre/MbcA/ParS toxin-binding domain-containing protein, partial [Phenylobacterium sp.]|uniref:antitoxin Xre/MbcA/ParS toxin-binding domain-containing protein n=1 Tax=Phenylobacterium sp. TaxID=1871053 RepID=UPI0035C85448